MWDAWPLRLPISHLTISHPASPPRLSLPISRYHLRYPPVTKQPATPLRRSQSYSYNYMHYKVLTGISQSA